MSTQPLTSRRLEFDDPTEAIEFYFSMGWTDGLPVVPPTAERVRRFLEHAGRSPSQIVGEEPIRGRVITAEKVATNAVMAGCLPQYLPVVLAAVEAMCEPQFNLHAVTVSTMGAAVLAVVNGPISRTLGLNSGVSVFGPGHRANATIGRAIRLVISNVTGAVPGILDKATLGHAGKYTWCIAEAEDASPWEPLHVERGLTADQSAVTIFPGLSPIQVVHEVAAGQPGSILTGLSEGIFLTGSNQEEIVVVLTPETIGHMQSAGWSKRRVKELVFEETQRRASDRARSGETAASSNDGDKLTGIAQAPDSITLIVAGGQAGTFSHIIPLWGGGSNSRPVTREIRAPEVEAA